MFFDELDFDHEDHKFEPHGFFGEPDVNPLDKDVVPPNNNSLDSDGRIYKVPHPKMVVKSNPPLLTFRVDDAIGEFELPNISRFHFFSHVQIQKKLLF